MSNSNNQDQTRKQIKSSSKLNVCQVCGDKANIVNYGALSCQSCKTFFRRNGFHPEVCSKDVLCKIILSLVFFIECSSMLF